MCQDWPSGVPGTTFPHQGFGSGPNPSSQPRKTFHTCLSAFKPLGCFPRSSCSGGPWGCVYPSKLNSSRVQTPIILAVKLLALTQLILRRGSGVCTAPSAAFSVGPFAMRKILRTWSCPEKSNRAERGLKHSSYVERLREWDGSVWITEGSGETLLLCPTPWKDVGVRWGLVTATG